MRIKFGRMYGSSLTLSHSEKKARRTTDLDAFVNHNSWPGRCIQRTSPAAFLGPANQVLFVVFKARTIPGKHCARLVRGLRLFAACRKLGPRRTGPLTES